MQTAVLKCSWRLALHCSEALRFFSLERGNSPDHLSSRYRKDVAAYHRSVGTYPWESNPHNGFDTRRKNGSLHCSIRELYNRAVSIRCSLFLINYNTGIIFQVQSINLLNTYMLYDICDWFV
jgi:hypothetical protein